MPEKCYHAMPLDCSEVFLQIYRVRDWTFFFPLEKKLWKQNKQINNKKIFQAFLKSKKQNKNKMVENQIVLKKKKEKKKCTTSFPGHL